MSIMSAVIVYVVIWTVVLFMILPIGVQVPENIEKGHASSAPLNPRIWEKLFITSLISAFLWVLAFLFFTSEYASLN